MKNIEKRCAFVMDELSENFDPVFAVATYLSPKWCTGLSENLQNAARVEIKRMVNSFSCSSNASEHLYFQITNFVGYFSEEHFNDEPLNEGSAHDENDIFAAALAVAKQRRHSGSLQASTQVDVQLDSYYAQFSSKNAPAIKDELEYWDTTADFPILKDVAICVLAIPATLAPVERISNIPGSIRADQLLRLSDSNLENKVMIRANKKLLSSLFFR